jgi:hypothetical protein
MAALAIMAMMAALGWWRATRPVERPLMRLSVDLGRMQSPANSPPRNFTWWSAAGIPGQESGRHANARHAITRRDQVDIALREPRTEETRSFRPMENGSGFSPTEK